MTQLRAALYAVICLGVILFQMCLIAGAPWGRLTQGGRHPGKLPVPGRIAAGLSIVLLLAMGASILSAAEHWPHWPVWTGWATLATTTVSTILNLITPSRAERRLWGPITLVMLGLALTVMLAARQ
jgi:hypothetical protein